ncbi:MAG: serine acetyltransferase [bacterium]|nr:serine acetyltransferase [bacterium]
MSRSDLREQTLDMIEQVVEGVETRGNKMLHLSMNPLPQKREVIKIIRTCQEVLFPGYFGEQELYRGNFRYHLGDRLYALARALRREVTKAFLMPSDEQMPSAAEAEDRAGEVVFKFMSELPSVLETVVDDVEAAYDGDPAASGPVEIIMAYPGFKAIYTYRIANVLYRLKVPLVPRIMTEFAHNETGVDIHPGARIGRHFFIDHGTGVVVGETTDIADRVKLYQGVTLGALSFPKDERGELIRGAKRHPTIEENVVIYAGATILGGDTVIGRDSVIGGNVWLVTSVEPDTRVVLSRSQLAYEVTQREE